MRRFDKVTPFLRYRRIRKMGSKNDLRLEANPGSKEERNWRNGGKTPPNAKHISPCSTHPCSLIYSRLLISLYSLFIGSGQLSGWRNKITLMMWLIRRLSSIRIIPRITKFFGFWPSSNPLHIFSQFFRQKLLKLYAHVFLFCMWIKTLNIIQKSFIDDEKVSLASFYAMKSL